MPSGDTSRRTNGQTLNDAPEGEEGGDASLPLNGVTLAAVAVMQSAGPNDGKTGLSGRNTRDPAFSLGAEKPLQLIQRS